MITTMPIPTEEEVAEYLVNKGVTLWLNWDITDVNERNDAVHYVLNLMHALKDYVEATR